MTIDFDWNENDIYHLLDSCERDGLLPFIEKYATTDDIVLESGCGLSRWVKKLNDMGYPCLGLEYSEDTNKKVKKIWSDLELFTGDILHHPFKNNTFDLVISLGVIEHFEEGPTQALFDIARILKPGGLAIITVPCFNTIRQLKHPLTRNKLKIYHKKKIFFEYRFSPNFFLYLIKETGFEIIEHKPFAIIDGFYHDLNPLELIIKFKKWKFYPQDMWINKKLSKIPYFHCHMQIVTVRKPFNS